MEKQNYSSEETKKFIKDKVCHYLKSYEMESKKNSSEVAEALGFSSVHYWRLKEGISNNHPVFSAYETIKKFSALKNITKSDFLDYLEGKDNPLIGEQYKIEEWQNNLLILMSNLDFDVRRFFTRRVVTEALDSAKKNKTFETLLACLCLMSSFDEAEDLNLVIDILKNLIKKKLKIQKKKNSKKESIFSLETANLSNVQLPKLKSLLKKLK